MNAVTDCRINELRQPLDQGLAESGAVDAETGNATTVEVPAHLVNDATLKLLIEAWPELPDTVKNRIRKIAAESRCKTILQPTGTE